jgi:hypothetical protein
MAIRPLTKHLSVPYVYNWNADMEQALWRTAALTAAYIGNKGDKLYSVRDINQNVYNNDTEGDELSGRPFITGEYNDRWNLHGNPKNIHW